MCADALLGAATHTDGITIQDTPLAAHPIKLGICSDIGLALHDNTTHLSFCGVVGLSVNGVNGRLAHHSFDRAPCGRALHAVPLHNS